MFMLDRTRLPRIGVSDLDDYQASINLCGHHGSYPQRWSQNEEACRQQMIKLMHCLPSDRAGWNQWRHRSRCNNNHAQ